MKWVDLTTAIRSMADKIALQRVSDYIRRSHFQSSPHTDELHPSEIPFEDMHCEIENIVRALGV